jgi:iron complex outermembrane receptor protein
MEVRPLRVVATAIVGLVVPALLCAQTGVLAGTVRGTIDGRPVSGADIRILGAGIAPRTAATDSAGAFDFTLPPATYTLIIRAPGYEELRRADVRVTAGATVTLDLGLVSEAITLNPLVVSVSRRAEKALDAPAEIGIRRDRAVAERIAPTPVEHIKDLPGIDAAQSGLQQSYVVARGFNNVFTGALLLLTDNRYAHVPSNRLNAHYMIPVTDLDIDRIEVTLGPGAALYGPNAASGVMHVITKSPIDHTGASVSLAGGERSVFHGMFRAAAAPSERFGFKVSGQYFRGDDWRTSDPVEEAARAADPGNALIGARDFTAERWSGDARADYRWGDDTEWITSAGVNMTLNNIELTGAGRSTEVDWRYTYAQTRLRSGRFFAQLFGNFSDAGESRLLRTGQVVVDDSRMYAAQVQHGADVGPLSLSYGLDLQRTDTRTGGTITGRFEDDDRIDEAGAYVHAVARLGRFDLLAAFRADHHNRLDDLALSPRAGLVFRPRPDHTLRATYNRAFTTPTVLNLFLDLLAANLPIVPGISYEVRAVGVPSTGYTFDHCAGGFRDLCMRVPGAPTPIPANATLLWDALIQALAPSLAPLLPNPGASVGTVLRRLDLENAAVDPFPLDEVGPRAIAPVLPTISNTFEVGYKGLLEQRLLLSASIYYTHTRDFVGPVKVETPNVFLDPASTSAYVAAQLAPLVESGAIDDATVQALIGGLVAIPLGTVSPAQWDDHDILLTWRNFGNVNVWGVDLAGRYVPSARVSLAGALSWVNEECFDAEDDGRCFSPLDIALNAPTLKGSLSARYEVPPRGFHVEGRVRHSGGFPMSSGVFVGDVESYTVFDATAGLRLASLRGASVGLTVSNLFDARHREFIGAPAIGRLALLRLRYDL